MVSLNLSSRKKEDSSALSGEVEGLRSENDQSHQKRERDAFSHIAEGWLCGIYAVRCNHWFLWILIEESESITASHDSPLKNRFELWSDFATESNGTGIQFDLSGAIVRTCHSSRFHSKLVDRIRKWNLYRLHTKTPIQCTSPKWHTHTHSDVISFIQELNETNPGCNRKTWKWVGLNYLSSWPDIFLRPPTVGWSIIPGWSSIFLLVFIENSDHIQNCRYHYSCIIYSVACYCSKTWISINDYIHGDNEHCFAPLSPSGRPIFVYDAVECQVNHSIEVWQFDFITKLEVNCQLLIASDKSLWIADSESGTDQLTFNWTKNQLATEMITLPFRLISINSQIRESYSKMDHLWLFCLLSHFLFSVACVDFIASRLFQISFSF